MPTLTATPAKVTATLTINTRDHATLVIGGEFVTGLDVTAWPDGVVRHGNVAIHAHGYIRTSVWQQTANGEYAVAVEPHPLRCETCVDGCDCMPGNTGCGHYGCWQADAATANTCPGVTAVG